MSHLNVVILSGDITVAPTARKAANGKEFIEFRHAVKSKWRDIETGDIKEEVYFHRVIAWGECGQAAKKLAKGASVTVEGQLIIRLEDWGDDLNHYVTEIVAKNITVFNQ